MVKTKTKIKKLKVRIRLNGPEGNAFIIVGMCQGAWRKAGLPETEWKKIMADMMSGDYAHLLAVTRKHFSIN
jgi:hypothetical protein